MYKRISLSLVALALLSACILCFFPGDKTASAYTYTSPKPTVQPATVSYPFEKQQTPNSTCFSEIGYNSEKHIVFVRFRSSGAAYIYYAFPQQEWDEFTSATSLGGYYNKHIKGFYYCERVYE